MPTRLPESTDCATPSAWCTHAADRPLLDIRLAGRVDDAEPVAGDHDLRDTTVLGHPGGGQVALLDQRVAVGGDDADPACRADHVHVVDRGEQPTLVGRPDRS